MNGRVTVREAVAMRLGQMARRRATWIALAVLVLAAAAAVAFPCYR